MVRTRQGQELDRPGEETPEAYMQKAKTVTVDAL